MSRIRRAAGRWFGSPRSERDFEHVRFDADVPVAEHVSQSYLLRRKEGARRYPVLNDPPLVRADALALPDDGLVLGIECDGEARAYPIPVMRMSHIANDRLAGRPIVMTFCERCFSGLAFDASVDGRRLTFEIYGAYLGAFAMRDKETGTIWSTLSGEALAGSLVDRRLAMLPTELASIARWVARHPESTAPDVPLKQASPAPRQGTPPDGSPWWRSVPSLDRRLPSGSLVVGVALDGGSRAYPVDLDRRGPCLVQDEVAGVPIALLAESGAQPVAFERRNGSGVLQLRLLAGRIMDQHGTEWSGSGRAVGGPAAGETLPFVPSLVVQWYAWAAHYPDTEVVAIGPIGTC